jgi:hypothetical protein
VFENGFGGEVEVLDDRFLLLLNGWNMMVKLEMLLVEEISELSVVISR